jgi:hypothetical protein
MKKWIQSVLSSEGDQSSKRLIGLYCVITGSVMAWIGTFTEFKTPEYMYNTIMFTGAGAFIGTVVESVFLQKLNKPQPTPPQDATDTPTNEETVQ